jgi:gamma-glutamyl:cysteine ligase YbdK (ATP-grasp superfamily)
MTHSIDPLTVGYDWEMAVLRRTGENVAEEDVAWLADELRRRLPWSQTGTDLELIESRIGALRSFGDLLDRSERFEDELRRVLKEKEWVLLRAGTRPFEREPVGAHIHVGTIRDWTAAIRIQNAMARYVPPLAALMANSPIYRRRTGEYKSYRVASYAEWCSRPQAIVDPSFSQPDWGGDVCTKLAIGSTVELRVGDGVSSTRLMCEVVALVAGLMCHVAEHELDAPLSEDDYDTVMVNRWRAAKHGLQAILTWGGREVPVQTVLTSMVDLAEDGMKLLGASRGDLRIVRTMIRKRQTQADFQLAVFAKERGDAHRMTRTMANIQRDRSAFEKYLRRAPTLDVVKPDDYGACLLSAVEVETPYPLILRSSPLSPAALDAILDRFVEDGRLLATRSNLGVRLYTRAELGGAGRGAGGHGRAPGGGVG